MFASNLPQRTVENTACLLRSVGERFGQCIVPETHRSNLYTIKKGPEEYLQEYSARVSHRMLKAYPGIQGTKTFDSLSIEHFLRGISNQKLA